MSFSPCLSHASSFHALISACGLLLFLAFLLFDNLSRVFCAYVLVIVYTWGSDTAMYEVLLFLLYPAYEGVTWFVLNWMDVNMNTVILRLHPTRGSPNNVCLVTNAWYNCSTRYDTSMRSEFGISARQRPVTLAAKTRQKRVKTWAVKPAAGDSF